MSAKSPIHSSRRLRAAYENLLALVIDICPLKTEALRNTQSCRRDKQCEGALRLRHGAENLEALLRV